MKKVLLSIATVSMFSISAFADSVHGYFGFSQSAFNLGAGYEHMVLRNVGFGGLFHLASEQDSGAAGGHQQVMTLAGNSLLHFQPGGSSDVDFYAGPGFGLHMIDGTAGADDETAIGPTLQIGATWRMNDKMSLGLEQLHLYNWMSKDAVSSAEFMNATIVFSM